MKYRKLWVKKQRHFVERYDVTTGGNWEGKNILRILNPEKFISEMKEEEWKKKLMEVRSKRIRPLLDDKILCGWNAMMISALCKAYASLGDESYKRLAKEVCISWKKKCGERDFSFLSQL